jgi:hypothetical protein
VVGINWSLSSLRGTLPVALAQLEFLSALNFSGNNISGVVPPELVELEARLENKMKWGPAVTYLGTVKQFYHRPDVTEVIIPYSFKEISFDAFRGCINLTKLKFGEEGEHHEIKVIGEGAFFDCHDLNEIRLPEGLEEIAESAFYNSGVAKLDLPSTVKVIGDRAFYNCKNLTEVIVPPGLTSIGKFAFADCPLLESIRLPQRCKIDESR